MGITGRSRFEALSAADDSVKLGDTHVPRRVAYVIDGTGGSPSLRVDFEVRADQVRCEAVHAEAAPRGRGVRSGDLSALPALDRLGVEAFAEFAVTISDGTDGPPDWWTDHALLYRRTRSEIRSGGDQELREVARIYREAVDDRPREAVAAALGLGLRTASRRIEAARAKGFLPPTTQGKRQA